MKVCGQPILYPPFFADTPKDSKITCVIVAPHPQAGVS